MTGRVLSRLRESASARAAVGSLGAAVAAQVALMASGVAVARMLGVENRGHFALFVVLVAILALVGGLGIPAGATYFLARGISRDKLACELRPVLTTQFALLTPIHAVVLFALFRNADPTVRTAAWISLLALPCSLLQSYGFAVLQGEQRFRALNCVRLLPAGVYATAIGIAYAAGLRSLVDITVAWTAAVALVAVLTLGVAFGRASKGESEGAVRSSDVVRFGAKGALGATSPLEALRLDQAVTGLLLSSQALGLYSVGMAFTNLPRLIGLSLGYIAYPTTASRTSLASTRRTIVRFAVAGCVLTAVVVATLELLSGWLVPFFFGDAFRPAVNVTRLLLVAAFLASMRKLLADCAQGAGFPAFGSLAEIVSWTVLVPALALLTPRFGINGVAASIALAYAASLTGLAFQLARAMCGEQERRAEPALRPSALVGVELRQSTLGDR